MCVGGIRKWVCRGDTCLSVMGEYAWGVREKGVHRSGFAGVNCVCEEGAMCVGGIWMGT